MLKFLKIFTTKLYDNDEILEGVDSIYNYINNTDIEIQDYIDNTPNEISNELLNHRNRHIDLLKKMKIFVSTTIGLDLPYCIIDKHLKYIDNVFEKYYDNHDSIESFYHQLEHSNDSESDKIQIAIDKTELILKNNIDTLLCIGEQLRKL